MVSNTAWLTSISVNNANHSRPRTAFRYTNELTPKFLVIRSALQLNTVPNPLATPNPARPMMLVLEVNAPTPKLAMALIHPHRTTDKHKPSITRPSSSPGDKGAPGWARFRSLATFSAHRNWHAASDVSKAAKHAQSHPGEHVRVGVAEKHLPRRRFGTIPRRPDQRSRTS